MDTIVRQIEKYQPFFDKLARNKYLNAIRDGFLTAMPAILFSSLFILCASIPEIFGWTLPAGVSSWLWKVYNLSMGMVAVLVAATTAKSLADAFNRSLKPKEQINPVSCMLASICGLLVLAVTEIDGGINITYLGTRGLLASFISAFITCHMYRFCSVHNITIPMPEEVPGVISQMFRNIFPFSFSVLVCCAIDLVARNVFGVAFAEMVITLLSPLFQAADSYFGLCIIFGFIALFWFVGVHGPSIVEPAIAAVIYTNVELNLQLMQNGEHAGYVLTKGLMDFVGNMGGTGATLVVPFLFILFAKSKQLKAVGRTAAVPVFFSVNEPLLFGAPIVLNPYFFIPFLLAPMVNVCLFKFFVDVFSMNSFSYVIPWSTPAPIGIFLGAGFSVMTVIFIVAALVLDTVIYLPFVKAYDASLLKEESDRTKGKLEETEEKEDTAKLIEEAAATSVNQQIHALVLCVGAGTSQMFANALNKGAEQTGVNLEAQAEAYGNHSNLLSGVDVIILSPQVKTHYDEVVQDASKYGIQVLQTKGAQYIALTKDPAGAIDYVVKGMADKN